MDKAALRELAEKATPGPWITEDWASTDSDGAINVCGTSVMAPQSLCGIFTVALDGDETNDVEFIAAANPQTILSLLAEIQSLTEERTAWRTTAENAEAELINARKQMESQKDEWLSWEAKRNDLEKDAARYRWLRSVPNGFKAQRIVNDTPEGMDAAIDAAMKDEE